MSGLLRAESRGVIDASWILSSHDLSADEGSDLNAVVSHPTQRRLLIALVVTLACLPLLVLDIVSSSTGSGATEVASSSSDSSLVVATQLAGPTTTIDPSEVEMDAPSAVVEAPVETTTTTVAPRPQATTTVPRPAVTVPRPSPSVDEFLACVRWRESHNDYTASDPTGTFLGAYQIYQGGWDAVAAAIGRHDLVGVPPNHASPADQDAIAVAMFARYGSAPWGGHCD